MATSVSKANAAFSLALFKKLSEDNKCGNVFFSPFSISSALSMVLLGARGNTATQMSQVLCFTEKQDGGAESMEQQMEQQVQSSRQQPRCPPTEQDAVSGGIHCGFAQLLLELHKPEAPYSLSLANRLYGEQSFDFLEDFLSGTKKHYMAELETVDFLSSAEAARLNINGWVENQTQGKIKDLLVQGVLDSLTKLVLVNAIYFKGKWNNPFMETDTRDHDFKVNKKDTKRVKMMFQKTKFPVTYISEINCQILEMPYKGKDLSMLIFLPDETEDDTGLEKLEKKLSFENFTEWTRPDMMDPTEIRVGLPRFKMEEKYDLKDVLTNMGMVDAFDLAASNFSGMSSATDLTLSKVVHKAFVEVNEEGTEAAAATAAIMMLRCLRIQKPFIADHPFLFFIRHNQTNSILFCGRYCSPE